MDAGKLLDKIELYAREFVIYILSFFHNNDESGESKVFDKSGVSKTILFSILSIFIGSYISYWYIQSKHLTSSGLYDLMLSKFMKWLTMSLIVDFMLNFRRRVIPFIDSVVAVFKVNSVAYMAASYTAYIDNRVFAEFYPANAQISASLSAAIVITIFLIVFLPRELLKVAPSKAWSANFATVVIVAMTIWLNLIHYSEFACQNSNPCKEWADNQQKISAGAH